MTSASRIGGRVVMLAILVLLVSSTTSSLSAPAIAQPPECQYPDNTHKICGIFLRPGVRDEFKSNSTVAWSHTLDTLRGAQGGDAQRQQIIRRYLDYAILTSGSDSIGDFQFDIWVQSPLSDIRIYVPSNFTFGFVSSGSGDATTQDKIYSVWTDITNDYQYISVRTLTGDDPIAPGWDVVEVGRIPTAITFTPVPSFTVRPGLYHIRLFQMRAPFTAGLYHFKIYVDGESIGDGNFPIIIVKSSLQPAFVTGLVSLRRFAPQTNASGRVLAVGTTPEGKYAQAVAYFGPKDFEEFDLRYGEEYSSFRYWLFGLPAGTFELTASASGFLKTSYGIIVDPGQSLTRDFVLEKCSTITVTVWSKDMAGPIPWGNLWQPPYGTNNPFLPIDDGSHHRDILFRLFDQYEESVGYWGSDDIDPPYAPPITSATIDEKRDYSTLIMKPSTLPSTDSYTASLTDARGLASLRLDGHVPADSADLIEGIQPGFYKLEIYVTGYAMRQADDWQRTLEIQSDARNYTFQVDLRRTTWITATAHIAELEQVPVSNATFTIVAVSPDNVEQGVAAGVFPAGAFNYTIILEGFNGIFNNLRPITAYQDYGLPPNDYVLQVYMSDMGVLFGTNLTSGNGWYIVNETRANLDIVAHADFGATSFSLSFHLVACSVEITLRSIWVQQPAERAPWTFPGAGIRILLIDELGRVAAILDPTLYGLVQDDGTIGTIIHDPYDIDTGPIGLHGLLRVLFTGVDPGPIAALGGIYPTRLAEGKYYVNAATLGYIQRRQDVSLVILAGIGNDLKMDLVQGTQIRVVTEFRHENVPTVFNGFVRVEVYSQDGTLVGASIYSGAQPNANSNYLAFDPSEDWKLVQGAAEGAGNATYPQRAFISFLHYMIPPATWANWPAMTPSDANRLSVPYNAYAAFDVFGFHWYYGGPDSRIDELWANGWDTTNGVAHFDSGIAGSRDALDLQGWGNFTIHVWAFDPYGPNGVFDSNGPDGIFGTDDDYTSPDSLDGSLSDFRAFSQVADVQDVQAAWGGVATVHVILEEQPSLSGIVYWTDMFGDLRTLPWAQVIERSPGDIWTSSATGAYKLWLSPGSHDIYVTTIGESQLWETFQFSTVLAKTGVHSIRDVTIVTSGAPIPEFPTTTLALIIPIALLLMLIRRGRRRGSDFGSR